MSYTPRVKNESDSTGLRPDKLDVRRFAREQASLQGETSLAQFQRLREDTFGLTDEQCAAIRVVWTVQGVWRELRGGAAETRLRLHASAGLPLQCQRCLEPVQEALVVDRQFLFVADEATALALDEESEDDVLVASKTFNLLELIEDELLMALPLVPRHGHCVHAVVDLGEGAIGDEDERADAEQPGDASPFSSLQHLKKH